MIVAFETYWSFSEPDGGIPQVARFDILFYNGTSCILDDILFEVHFMFE